VIGLINTVEDEVEYNDKQAVLDWLLKNYMRWRYW
jgi:hypothetical protein